MMKTPLTFLQVLSIFSFSVLLLLLPFVTAEIKTLTITADSRPMILFEKFGFTHTGHVTVSVSGVSVASTLSSPDPSRLGFFLLSEESLLQVLMELQQNPSFCVLDSQYILSLFTFRDLSPPPHASFNQSYPVSSPNEYSLFFANCAPESQVTMSVRTTVYNIDNGKTKDYLSAGQTQLPALYFLFSLAYFAFLVFWIHTCYINKRSVHRIHMLMAGLLLMKALNLICAAEDKHYVKVTGTPHGWDVLFYIFQFIRVVLLFTVIVLVGTGWSFLKPFLQEKEKKVLMIVIPLQVLANVASVVIGETGPFIKDWVTWNQVFLLVDIVCCCAIIFPIVWSIRSLRETSKTDGKAARNLAKLTLFRQFYIVVIGYLYFTRIVVFALRTIAAYRYQWVSNAAEEIASLAFYLVMFYMFQPAEKNEYFVLDEEEEEAAMAALREEEFEL
ncbi:Protein GPR107 [Vitis vinifera]|uniref:Protein GPR107 n=1 Tax=Vitis vinifera TaxID=29760 RepID=A0A438IQD5_VITVI|nr:Protein GPR107 [Vitis vinifera]